MQRTKDQVACQRGLNSNLRCLQVSNFTHQNDVRILPQNRTQTRRKRNANVMVDLDLYDPVNVILDRILSRDQLFRDLIHLRQGRIQRRCLARTGRTGHQHNSVRTLHDLPKIGHRHLVHPYLGQRQRYHRSVQDSHNHALAEHGRQYAHAQVHLVPTHHQLDSTVLWQTSLGNIQIRHNLDSRGNRKGEVTRRGNHFV